MAQSPAQSDTRGPTSAPGGPAPAPAPSATVADGFRPVAGAASPTGAEATLVAGYLVMWVLLLVFVWLSFRRQQRLAARVDDLERTLERLGPADQETQE